MRSTRPGSCFACASFLFDLPYLPDQLVKLALYLEGMGSLFGRGRGIVGRGLVVPWRRRVGGAAAHGGPFVGRPFQAKQGQKDFELVRGFCVTTETIPLDRRVYFDRLVHVLPGSDGPESPRQGADDPRGHERSDRQSEVPVDPLVIAV